MKYVSVDLCMCVYIYTYIVYVCVIKKLLIMIVSLKVWHRIATYFLYHLVWNLAHMKTSARTLGYKRKSKKLLGKSLNEGERLERNTNLTPVLNVLSSTFNCSKVQDDSLVKGVSQELG